MGSDSGDSTRSSPVTVPASDQLKVFILTRVSLHPGYAHFTRATACFISFNPPYAGLERSCPASISRLAPNWFSNPIVS
jgi:hypothetical protein